MIKPFIRPFTRPAVRGFMGDSSVTPASPKAAAVIGIGQSLMAGRGGTIVQSGGGTSRMAVGGAHISAFSFWSGNATNPVHEDDWASLATFAEGGSGQSPLAGVANTLTGYADAVLHSAAIGARGLVELHKAFHQVSAAVERSVALLVADGYDRANIDVIFAIKHGEADAAAGMSQADYEALFASYINRCRYAAKQALQSASYVAKVHMSFPIQQSSTDDARAIKKALLAQADALGGFNIGEVYSVPVETDRTHPTPAGYVLMGERAASQIVNNTTALRCNTFTGSGTAWAATFNKPVVRDASFSWGTDLNAANAEDGLEVWDQGASAYIAINSLTYNTNSIDITLASTPSGTPELRIAVQDTAGTLVGESGPAGDIHNPDHVGCAVRSTDAGWSSTYDPTYTHYDWCIPQTVEAT